MTTSNSTSSKSRNKSVDTIKRADDYPVEDVTTPKVKPAKKAAVTPASSRPDHYDVQELPIKSTHYNGSTVTDKRPLVKTESKKKKQTVEVPSPKYKDGLTWTNARTQEVYQVGVDVPKLVWGDVQRVLITLVEDGVLGHVVPSDDPWAEAQAMRAYTREEWEDVLPLIATLFIESIDTGSIPNSTRNQVRLWIVWWWLHKTSGWPRPPVQKQIVQSQHEIVAYAPEYECPACKMKWRADSIVSLDKELSLYSKWLSTHAKVHTPAKKVRAPKKGSDYLDIPRGHTEPLTSLDLGLDTPENVHELTISDRAAIARRRLEQKMEAHTKILQARRDVPTPPTRVYTRVSTLLTPLVDVPKEKPVRKPRKKVTAPK